MAAHLFRVREFLWRAPVVLAVALLLSCAQVPLGNATPVPPNTVASPIPPGMARIWIYRDYDPYSSLGRPYVRLNGRIIGISELGGAFYRDVPPGVYRVTVDSIGRDVNQWTTVAVVPGQQVFVRVDADPHWDCGGGNRGGGWCRDTYYTRLELPQIGAAAVAHLPNTGGA